MTKCLSVTKNDHFLSALAERLWPSDGDDDDAHLDCSQVNQQPDCQTTSTASQLPWLIVLLEDGDDGDDGHERDNPNKRWWRWCWGQIRCVCTACCWHMICLSWSEEGNITCIVAVKATIYIYPHLVKTKRLVYLDIIPRPFFPIKIKNFQSRLKWTIGKSVSRLKSFGNSRQHCLLHLPKKSLLWNQDKLLKNINPNKNTEAAS